jgi:hypothetical protein
MNLSKDDLELLWIGSFRYFLGRMTISTHSFCDSIIKNWDEIPQRAQVIIERELFDAIERDDQDRKVCEDYKALGHDCDSQKWREVWNLRKSKNERRCEKATGRA